MRFVGLLVVSVVSISLAVAVPTSEAVTAPFTVLGFAGSGADPAFAQDFFFDSAHGSLEETVGTVSQQVSFVGTTAAVADTEHTLQVDIDPNGATLAASANYDLATSSLSVSVSVDFEFTCTAATGTLSISDLVTDGTSGVITALAAEVTGATCQTNTPAAAAFGIDLRLGSAQPYEAVATSPRNWNFGDQITGLDGQPKTFIYANTGVDAVTFGTASAGAAPRPFRIAADTCSQATVLPGGSCHIRVVPHPTKSVTASYLSTVRQLALPISLPVGVRTRVIRLTEYGHDFASTYTDGGPERATLTIGRLPAPADAFLAHYRVDWGTSPTNLAQHRSVAPVFGVATVTHFSGLHGGRNYYFRITPVFTSGQLGDPTALLAARPWPKYAPGMYHRITPFRLVSDHQVAAGHPVTLSANGQHGVPSRHVQAVVLNVTASDPSEATAVRVYPAGTRAPAPADITVDRGAVRSNFVIAKVNSAGRFTIATTHGSTPVTVDVSGYYSGSGLTTKGSGAALRVFAQGGTLIDTKNRQKAPLPGGYFTWSAMNFTPGYGQHVTSLVVAVTAYGSKGSGTIAAYAKDTRIPHTSVLSYSPGVATTSTAIVSASRWVGSDGYTYPAVSFLNRGKQSVQLRVTTLGYYDDATFEFGQRYIPSAPLRLLADRMGSGATDRMSPGRHANKLTSTLNLKVTAAAPTRTTTLGLWPRGLRGVTRPVQPQLSAPGGVTTTASTMTCVGSDNGLMIKNAAGSVGVTVWSFGRFDAYPVPANDFLGAPRTATFASSAPSVRPTDHRYWADAARRRPSARHPGGYASS
ncbi:MAG: hypothetical protein QOI15_1653 [Pseudonocardiales bacterium]|nr:hypothetical protein [Pseudonocardiales bacterium]